MWVTWPSRSKALVSGSNLSTSLFGGVSSNLTVANFIFSATPHNESFGLCTDGMKEIICGYLESLSYEVVGFNVRGQVKIQ